MNTNKTGNPLLYVVLTVMVFHYFMLNISGCISPESWKWNIRYIVSRLSAGPHVAKLKRYFGSVHIQFVNLPGDIWCIIDVCNMQDFEAECTAIKADCEELEDKNKNLQTEVSETASIFIRFYRFLGYFILLLYTHPFNDPLSGSTRVSQYQKGETFTEARDSEWQRHQLAICKSAPRSRQITMPAPHHSVSFLQARCPSCLIVVIED